MARDRLKSGWTRVAFGDVVRLCTERTSNPAAEGFERYIGLDHLDPGNLAIRRWGDVANGTTFTTVFRPGQVLFGKRRAYQRKVAVPDFTGVCSGDIYVLEPKDDGYLLPEFLPFVCQTEAFFEHAIGTSAGSLSPRTNWNNLANYGFAFPPLDEQRKIATILSSLDSLINNMRLTSYRIHQTHRSLMHEILAHGIPGKHTQFKDTTIGKLPLEWDMVQLQSVSSVERGRFTHRPRNEPRLYGGPYPFIQTGDITACDGFIRAYQQTLSEDGLAVSRIFPTGTIAITIAANIGATGITTFPVAFPDSIVGIQAGPRIDTHFLELVLRARKRDFERLATESVQKNINLDTLRPLLIPLPCGKEQKEIVNCMSAVTECHSATRVREERLATLRAAMLNHVHGQNM